MTVFICLTFFKNMPSQILITFNAWTSKAYDPYLAITAHYINAPSDQPLEWELKSKLLGFEGLQGSHTGANVTVKIVEVLDQYNIRNKASFMSGFMRTSTHLYFYQLSWAMADNLTANDKVLQVIQQAMPNSVQKWYA
jgi:hypothetical protein